LAVRRTSQWQPQLTQFRPLVPRAAFRSYSTENQAAEGEKKENGAEEAKEAEDPCQKELEEKKKEVVDLKVIPSRRSQLPV
jgi:molecular chaperone GrpE